MSHSNKRFSRRGPIWSDPTLRAQNPESLRRLDPLTENFGPESDPLIRAQIEDRQKTEAQRRGEQGRGSLMVKLSKPLLSLRPKHQNAPLRKSFNRAWMREQREASLAHLQKQREAAPTNEQAASLEICPAVLPQWER